jgi:hypothetical protein
MNDNSPRTARSKALQKLRGRTTAGRVADLQDRIAGLEEDVAESRRLNERLSDVLDVVVELLVPATQRDDGRLDEALKRLNQSVPQ